MVVSCSIRTRRFQAFAAHMAHRITSDKPAVMADKRNHTGRIGDHQAVSSLSGINRYSDPSELWCIVESVTAAIASMTGPWSTPGRGRNVHASAVNVAKV